MLLRAMHEIRQTMLHLAYVYKYMKTNELRILYVHMLSPHNERQWRAKQANIDLNLTRLQRMQQNLCR